MRDAVGIEAMERAVARRVFVPKAGHGSNAQIKKPTRLRVGFFIWAPGGDLLSRGQSALSSALSRFTVLFGMGRRGSNSLWPPSKLLGSRREGLRPAWLGRVALKIWKKY